MALKEILCPKCGSATYKAGISCGNQKYKCRNPECKITFKENYKNKGWKIGMEAEVLKKIEENCSMRGTARMLGVSLLYVIKVVKKSRARSSTSTIS